MLAPWAASARQIAAPMPRVPPVTSATRPSSLSPTRAAFWLSCVVAMSSLSLFSSLAVRALAEPLGEVRPDLLARPRAGHEADVATRPVEVRDVLAADHVEQRQRPLARGDVVRAGGHHEQVLVHLAQVDALAAKPQALAHQAVLLVHEGDPVPVRLARERRVVGHPPRHRLVGLGLEVAAGVPDVLPEAPVRRPVVGDRLHHLVGEVDRAAGDGAVHLGHVVDVERVARRPVEVQRAARVDGRREQQEVAHGVVLVQRAVQERHRAADAPAEHAELVLAARAQHLAGGRRDLVADVVVEPEVVVGLVRDAPVEQEDVVALVDQELDERVPAAQVEDVGPVDEGEDEEHRNGVRRLRVAVAVQRRLAMRPDDVLRRRPDRRVALGEDGVGELERGYGGAGEALERRHDDEERRVVRWRVPLPLPLPLLARLELPPLRLRDVPFFEPSPSSSRSSSTSWRTCSSLSSVRPSARVSRLMSWRLATRRLRSTRSIASLPMRVSATTFSVTMASSSPKLSRDTTRSAALATRLSASSYSRRTSWSGVGAGAPSELGVSAIVGEAYARAAISMNPRWRTANEQSAWARSFAASAS